MELMLSRCWNHSRWATRRSRWRPGVESGREWESDWDSELVLALEMELASASESASASVLESASDLELAREWELDWEPVLALETELASVLGSRKPRSKQNQTSLQFRC